MADSKAASAHAERIAQIRAALPEIATHLRDYACGKIGASGADERICIILFQAGYAQRKQIHSMKVGFHNMNCGGVLGHSMNVQRIMENIAVLWFSWKECDHALCVDKAEGDTSDEDAYRKWCDESAVDFPAVGRFSLEFFSLACGHTNTSLRSIICGCLSNSTVLGDGTNYCLDIIRQKDATYAEAAEEGLIWTVINHKVIEAFPELVSLFDASRNSKEHVQTPESEVSGMNKMWTEYVQLQKKGALGDYWSSVAESAVRSRPLWAENVEHYAAFLARHAAGIAGIPWRQFMSLHAHNVASDLRMMPGYVFEHLALVHSTNNVYAVLLADYLSPDYGVKNKRCEWFQRGQLKALNPNPTKFPQVVKDLKSLTTSSAGCSLYLAKRAVLHSGLRPRRSPKIRRRKRRTAARLRPWRRIVDLFC